ncbi:MAG: hypothetical protein ACK4MD_04175 [Demequina sp.]
MSTDHPHSPQGQTPDPHESPIPELEDDQTVAPRPEEEIADALRSEPDFEGRGNQSE